MLLGWAGCSGHRVALPGVAVAALEREAPGVEWDPGAVVKGDFNYDGVADVAVGGSRGDRYVVGIVAGPMREGAKVWALEFAMGEGHQDALCSLQVRMVGEKVTEEAFVGAARLPAGSRGIALHDDLCDAFHIYWDAKQRRFRWWRL
jgi:hypothetical protein